MFTGSGGQQHGYKDRWSNEQMFEYSGEGQSGDMAFTKGNLALRDHIKNSKRIFLFEFVSKGLWRFISEMVFHDFGYYETHDTSGTLRVGIKFFFRRINEELSYEIPESEFSDITAKDGMTPYLKIEIPNSTERKGLVTSRVGQGAYRKSILHRWKFKCAVTQYQDVSILIASHIHSWKESNDDQRLDVDNGILLSPDFDALFDKHLISFENSGKIILPGSHNLDSLRQLGVSGTERIVGLTDGNKQYLEFHRQRLG